MTKLFLLRVSLVFVIVLGLVTVTHASLQVGDRITFSDQEGNTGGGEFGVNKSLSASPAGGNATTAELFRTFCLETTEFLDFSPFGFVIDSISKSAVAGGAGGGSPDPISSKTAWLYYNFRNNSLPVTAPYNYTPNSAGHIVSANLLQQAIWGFENEIAQNATWLANPFVQAANAAGPAALQLALDHTFVINIKWATDRGSHDGVYEKLSNTPSPFGTWSLPGPGDNAQSALYIVPEATAVVIWSMLGAIGVFRQRRARLD